MKVFGVERKLLDNKEVEEKLKGNCLVDYMVPVIELANQHLLQNIKEDNFMISLELNKILINSIIN